jgi:hypothetical protein
MKLKNWFVFRIHITLSADGDMLLTDTHHCYHVAASDARNAIQQALSLIPNKLRSQKRIAVSPYWEDGEHVSVTGVQVTNCTQVCPLSSVCEAKEEKP